MYYLHQKLPHLQLSSVNGRLSVTEHTIVVDAQQLLSAGRACVWGTVLELHKGDFLHTMEFRFPAEIDAWRDDVESSIMQYRAEALRNQVDDAERAGAWADVEHHARTLVTIGGADTHTYTQLVHALLALGRTGEARTMIAEGTAVAGEVWARECANLLQRDLTSSTSGPTDLRFVGRAAEFSVLRARWEQAKRGRASLVVLRGESGIGKSRLALQLAKLVVVQGAQLLQSHCFEAGHRVSYAPLETIAGELPEKLVASLPTSYQHLVNVLRGTESPNPEVVGTGDLRDRDDAIIHTFEKVLGLITTKDPLLIVIEDCQWIDAATADLLVYLISRMQASRTMVLCVARTDGPRARGLHTLENSALDIVTLGEMTNAESWSLANSYASTRESRLHIRDLQQVVDLSAGNPFYLIELLSSEPHTAPSVTGIPIPQSIRKLLARKYYAVSPTAQALAAAAAVLDRNATLSLLRRVSGMPRQSLVRPVDELLRAGFLRGTDADTLILKHDLIRETVYHLISPKLRQMLHLRAAGLLRRRSAPAAVVAYHADLAGSRRQAWTAALEAGDQALQISAQSDSLHWYEVAHKNGDTSAERIEACKRILHYAMEAGAPEKAHPYLSELRAAYAKENDRLGLLRCQHLELVADALTNSRPAPDIASQMLAGVEVAEDQRDGNLAVRVLRDAASVMQHNATPNELLSVVERMLAAAAEYRVEGLAQVYAFAALAHSTSGSRTHALKLAECAVQMAAESRRVVEIVDAYSARGSVRAANGMLSEGLDDYRHALRTAEEAGVFHRRAVLEVNYGVLLMDVGAYSEAEGVLSSARGKGERENPFAVANLASIAFETGRFKDAAELAGACESLGHRLHSVWLSAEAAALSGLVSLAHGDRTAADGAFARLSDSIDICVTVSSDPTNVVAFAARALSNRGETNAAQDIITKALRLHANRNLLVYRRIELELARLIVDDKPDQSFRLASDVAIEAKRLGARRLLAHANALLEEIELRGR